VCSFDSLVPSVAANVFDWSNKKQFVSLHERIGCPKMQTKARTTATLSLALTYVIALALLALKLVSSFFADTTISRHCMRFCKHFSTWSVRTSRIPFPQMSTLQTLVHVLVHVVGDADDDEDDDDDDDNMVLRLVLVVILLFACVALVLHALWSHPLFSALTDTNRLARSC
jgi:hypothetical protein